MQFNQILAPMFGVLAFVVGSNALDETATTSKSDLWPGHGIPMTQSTLRTTTKNAAGHKPTVPGVSRRSSAAASSDNLFTARPTHTAGMPFHDPPASPNNTIIGKPLEVRNEKFKCESGDKLMSYKSGRCDGREYYACCPRGWQDAFGEDCVGLPACKYDPKNGKPQRQWPGKSPNGCVNCADGYAATPGWYGGCMKEPLPASFNNGKCRGPSGNQCL